MSINDTSPERPTVASVLGGPVFGFLQLASTIALAAGGIGTLWLLASLVFGQYAEFASFSKNTQALALQNIGLAQMLITYGFGIGAILVAIVNFGEEVLGYLLVAGALVIGLAIPAGFQQFGGEAFAVTKSVALTAVYKAFLAGVLLPAAVGGLLIGYDVLQRIVKVIRERPVVTPDSMTFGAGAKPENTERPPRTSILGKCWEGPFCRDFIRPHCPVFLKRQACWTNKVGCYCEEDIVSKAIAKVTGPTLPMAGSRFKEAAPAANPMNDAPDPVAAGFQELGASGTSGMATRGFGALGGDLGSPGRGAAALPPRKVELSPGQKRERCRNCVIYNEHQREKYGLLLPMTIIGTLLLCGFFALQFQTNATAVVTGIETLINRFSFLPGDKTVEIGKSSAMVAWLFIGAGTIMIVSKSLQFLEWCVFKIKI
ncbi:MAG: hypothetical protein H7Y38_14080 [Armatimonadetes bacterium]|nr:hypothetical protein [Armatimonadota bacterium]